MWDLVPRPEIKAGPSALGAQSLSPQLDFIKLFVFFYLIERHLSSLRNEAECK